MPAFIFISGYFSKKSLTQGIKKTLPILITYVVFQILYKIADGQNISFLTPHWILWFFLSLFFWKTILPYFIKLKWPLLWAFGISIIVGSFDSVGYYLSISRTIYFFPFFLLGYYTTEAQIQKIRFQINKLIPLFILTLFFIFLFYINSQITINHEWLFGSFSYTSLGAGVIEGSIYRIINYTISLFLLIILANIIPKSKQFYSKMGTRTLYVYVFHGLFVMMFYHYSDQYFTKGSFLIIALITSSLITLLLTLGIVERSTKYIVKPQLSLSIFNKKSIDRVDHRHWELLPYCSLFEKSSVVS